MLSERWRPRLSPDYVATVRRHAPDIALMLLLFFCVSLTAGRVWRFPFDDEIYTLTLGDKYTALAMLIDYARQTDVHPPLSYLLVQGLQQLGLSPAGMRLCSLAMTGFALAMLQLLTLSLIGQRSGRAAEMPTRLIAILLFGLCPLAISQGDALRWYPLFALLIALFVTLYLAGANTAARLASAVALGVAASTNILASPVALSLAIYRYGLQRRFRAGFDSAFWLLVFVCGSLGVYTAGILLFVRTRSMGPQLGNGVLRSTLTDLLGFFGGDALGLSQAWIVLPSIAITGLAIFVAVDRKQPANPVHLLLLMLATAALTVLPGFAKPRSFLYLAPVVPLLLTLFLDRLLRQGRSVRVLAMTVLLLAVAVAAIVNVNVATHPFKRNAAIPYATILDFVRANRGGRTLVVSTDPVVVWELRRAADGVPDCVSFFLNSGNCFTGGQTYDSIFLIRGHSDRSANAALMQRFDAAVERQTAGRRKVATLHAGFDADAGLKARLTGVALSEHILTIDLYR